MVPLGQYYNYHKLRTPAAPPDGLALAYTQAALAPLAFDSNWKTPAASATEFAFAPGMDAMRTLYAGGNLAVIAGVGLPAAETNPLSHLNGQLDWLTGQINVGSEPPSGWLGLTLDGKAAGKLGPTASMGGSTALLIGNKAQGLVINPPMDNFGVSYGTSDNYDHMLSAYKKIGVLPAANPSAAFDQQQMQAALADIHTIRQDAARVPADTYPTPTWLDFQLRDIARLIHAGAGIRGYYAVQGGYDTHSSQALTQPVLVSQLGQSLAKFMAFLQVRGVSKNVLVMTMSDFGRRPQPISISAPITAGQTVSFVLGDRVKGGVYGNYPSLSRLDENSNLKLNVDFRNVLSDLIGKMNGNPAGILGQTWPALGFI